MESVLPDSASSNEAGHLQVGGCDAVSLTERFGTPLIVFDKQTFNARARSFAAALAPDQVCYAGKAFLCVALCQLLDELGLSLDVCSGGELATAVAAAFPAERVLFHGNNKSVSELEQARTAKVGRIVADSVEEIQHIADLEIRAKLLLRVTPGVEAHTHEFVQTGQEDSKFGLTLAHGVAMEGLKRAIDGPGEVVGIHAHIGSQIFELAAFDLAVQRLAGFLQDAKQQLGFEAAELNLGGGFGIAHTRDELTPDPADVIGRLVELVHRQFEEKSLTVPSLFVEPGRAIVGSAAV
ncbi:MAG: diaminopimelate decarboxylase, partial [Actinomycetota bacterium]|nr:diaminopimelate decarboxylase [Actinomycetota bacterium]